MTRSKMVDCGMDYDYEATIRMGDAYEWGEEDWEDDVDDSDDCCTD